MRSRCCPRSSGREVAGPGFLNLWVTDAFVGEVLAEIDRATAAAPPRTPSGSRSRSSRPTRRGRSRSPRAGTAPTATAVARLLAFAGHEVEREYYYNDAGAQMDRFRASVEAVRAGKRATRGRLPRRLHRPDRRRAGRPGAADARTRSRGRWSGSGSTSTRGRARASSSETWSRFSTGSRPTSGTGRSSCARPTSATTRTAC